MRMEVKFLHLKKQYSPIEVTEEGIFTEIKPVQPAKALAPMEVTEEGI